MVEEVGGMDKDLQVRLLSTMFNVDESERRELVEELWSDPDRRYEFHEKRRIYLEESEIHREVSSGIGAEMREAVTRFDSVEVSEEAAPLLMRSLLKDAGAYEEYTEALVKAHAFAFFECVMDYLEIPHS